jgi:hypothetical protein
MGVEIRGIVRAEPRPWYRVPSNCRSETKNLLRSGRNCWGVDEMFSTDTRGNKEHKKEKDPGDILIPIEIQEYARVVLNEGENAHQFRTLSPQKDTYP